MIAGVAVTRLKTTPPAPATAAPTATIVPPTPVSAPAPAAAATGEAQAAAAKVQLQVTTVPPGAEVFLDAESLGPSPVDITRARSSEPLPLTIRKSGFKDDRRTLTLDHDQTLEIMLQAKRDKVAVRATHQGKRAQPAAPAPQPQAPQHHATDLRNPFE